MLEELELEAEILYYQLMQFDASLAKGIIATTTQSEINGDSLWTT